MQQKQQGPFSLAWNSFNPSMDNNHMPNKVWDGIILSFPNFNSYTVEVWEWIGDFIPHIKRCKDTQGTALTTYFNTILQVFFAYTVLKTFLLKNP